MPIRFRCSYCNRLLGIATRKAGMQTTCPHCGYEITVPIPEEQNEKTERLNLDDVDELLNNSASATMKEAAVVAPPVPPAPAPAQEEPLSLPSMTLPPPPPPPPAKPSKPPKPRAAPPPIPKAPPKPTNPDERPLFEADVDELLGVPAAPEEDDNPKPKPTSGLDAMSLDEPARQIVLSAPIATLLLLLVTLMMVLSFVAGYYLAPRG